MSAPGPGPREEDGGGKQSPPPQGPSIFPAVDLRGGRCVRLVRGERGAEIRYGEDPLEAAHRWEREGAEWIHAIDLGGALGGDFTRLHPKIQARFGFSSEDHIAAIGRGVMDEIWHGPF